jgi:hypothetical protein
MRKAVPVRTPDPMRQDRGDDLLAYGLRRMRVARAAHPGPILHLRAFPGHSTDTIGGQPDRRSFVGIVAAVVADGSLAYYSVYLDAEGRFVAVGMPES